MAGVFCMAAAGMPWIKMAEASSTSNMSKAVRARLAREIFGGVHSRLAGGPAALSQRELLMEAEGSKGKRVAQPGSCPFGLRRISLFQVEFLLSRVYYK
jgi:hypothetical protein